LITGRRLTTVGSYSLSLSHAYYILNLTPDANHVILATCFHPTFKLRWLPKITTDREKKEFKMYVNEIDCSAKQSSSEIESHSGEESESESFIIFASEPDQFRQQSSTINNLYIHISLVGSVLLLNE